MSAPAIQPPLMPGISPSGPSSGPSNGPSNQPESQADKGLHILVILTLILIGVWMGALIANDKATPPSSKPTATYTRPSWMPRADEDPSQQLV